jgi:(p)ppGpp synthase/HD superfamily hydrolase
MSTEIDLFQKNKVAMRYWLLGRKYLLAIKALEFGLKYHIGTRKDKITPEFQHQLSITNYARVFENHLAYPDETFASLLLHDVVEDYNISPQEISNLFGDKVSKAVIALTKQYLGIKKSIEYYYQEIGEDPIASIGKGCDRIHNIQSMVNVFTNKGQLWYIEETEEYIIPMLKKARRKFIEQESIYENIKHVLLSQIELIKGIHKAKGIQDGIISTNN